MVSWMWMSRSSTAGGPAPAELTAATRTKNLSPTARFRKVCWVTIMGRAFTGTQSKAERNEDSTRSCLAPWPPAPFLSGASLLTDGLGKLASLSGPYFPSAVPP